MSLIQVNWNPGPRELRTFGAVVFGGFALLGSCYSFWPREWGPERNFTAATVFFGLALLIGGTGLTGTRVALPFYRAWLGIAWLLGNVMSRVMLGFVFLLVVTPLGLVMRMTGRDALQLRRRSDTYWREIAPTEDVARYERQF